VGIVGAVLIGFGAAMGGVGGVEDSMDDSEEGLCTGVGTGDDDDDDDGSVVIGVSVGVVGSVAELILS